MSTYAAALAYRGLFGLFPFVLLAVVLVGLLGSPEFFDRLVEQARSEASRQVPRQLEPVVERGREQVQPLESMIERAEEQAGGGVLFFGVGVALWAISALARTLTEALNAAYEVTENRPRWKRSAITWAFGPVLALMAVAATLLMLVGPQLVGRVTEVVGVDALFAVLWGWLRLPVALLLLAVVLAVVYRYGPDARQRFWPLVLGAALAVFLWAIASVGFSFYLANFADYGVTYGSLGAAVGLLFYLYLSASILLLGAELNGAVRRADLEAPDGIMDAGETKRDA